MSCHALKVTLQKGGNPDQFLSFTKKCTCMASHRTFQIHTRFRITGHAILVAIVWGSVAHAGSTWFMRFIPLDRFSLHPLVPFSFQLGPSSRCSFGPPSIHFQRRLTATLPGKIRVIQSGYTIVADIANDLPITILLSFFPNCMALLCHAKNSCFIRPPCS